MRLRRGDTIGLRPSALSWFECRVWQEPGATRLWWRYGFKAVTMEARERRADVDLEKMRSDAARKQRRLEYVEALTRQYDKKLGGTVAPSERGEADSRLSVSVHVAVQE